MDKKNLDPTPNKPKDSTYLPIKDLLHRVVDKIEDIHNSGGLLTGISTGFPDIDLLTGGLRNGEMIVIGSRPSLGKTSLAANIADHVACEAKLPVGIVTLELGAEAYVNRMLCARARVNIRRIEVGFIPERDFPRLTGAAAGIMNAPLHVEGVARLSIGELREKAIVMGREHGIKLLIVDYLQLLRSDPDSSCDNREQEITIVAQGIKAIALELDIPVIALSQLNRDLERGELRRRPRLSDLRESGAIEDAADIVMLLYRKEISLDDEYCEQPDFVPINLLIAKHRNGITGEIYMRFFPSYTRFEASEVTPASAAAEEVVTSISMANLVTIWNAILAPELAKRSSVLGFDRNSLMIEADSQEVLQALIRDKPEILARFQKELSQYGYVVKSISIRHRSV